MYILIFSFLHTRQEHKLCTEWSHVFTPTMNIKILWCLLLYGIYLHTQHPFMDVERDMLEKVILQLSVVPCISYKQIRCISIGRSFVTQYHESSFILSLQTWILLSALMVIFLLFSFILLRYHYY